MKNFKIIIVVVFLTSALTSCLKKLDLSPTNNLTPAQLYSTSQGYQQAIAKVYSAWALTGNEGGAGQPDIPSQIISDEGSSDFFRDFWYLQCLTTDEAGWNYHSNTDPLLIHEMQWDASNQVVGGLYYRSFFQITLANDFIKQSSDANLSSRGITGASADTIRQYRAEARFIRAYQYWVLMDLYGNPPFVDENTVIGSTLPKQIQRADLFKYVESELKAIVPDLVAPRQNQYGRADQAAAWALLARIYLNAGVYTGTPEYDSAITYCNKVINVGYTLHPKYSELMLADNNLNTDEFILTIPYDGTHTQTYGGTTFLVNGPAGIPQSVSGGAQAGTWNCIRVTQQFVALFDTAHDLRGQFWTQGQTLEMTQLLDAPTNGYSSYKFRNRTRSGTEDPDTDPTTVFSSIDMPLFRLAEIYLIYAESVLRGATTSTQAQALTYYNALRTRAYGNTSGDVASISLQDILDERGRELFWEGFRRTDLIRYNQFTTGAYLWAWKGGVKNGTAVGDYRNLFPIPTFDISANHNLVQNPGY
ncbi:MAG TPA: RagB/SusD family nutrient uptake outer membrane protein [Hanamia sp.]